MDAQLQFVHKGRPTKKRALSCKATALWHCGPLLLATWGWVFGLVGPLGSPRLGAPDLPDLPAQFVFRPIDTRLGTEALVAFVNSTDSACQHAPTKPC